MNATHALPSTIQRRSWWNRWKWVVLCSAVLVFGLAMLAVVFGFLKHSRPAQMAMQAVRTNPLAARRLGEPIELGWIVSGKVKIHGDGGYSELIMPVAGPKARGAVYVLAQRHQGEWRLTRLELRIRPERTWIDLLESRSQNDVH